MATGTRAPSTIVTINLTGQTEFNIPFEYLARKFVVVTLLGSDRKVLILNTDYRFVGKTIISLVNPTPAGYTQLELRRETSATERLVDYHDGSILRAYDLNLSQLQTLHVAEEARDISRITLGLDDGGNLDARGRRIVNLADAVDDTDAVSLGQMRGFEHSAAQEADRAKLEADRAKLEADRANTAAMTATISNDTVWNRVVVEANIGARYSVPDNTPAIRAPRLAYKGKHYLPTELSVSGFTVTAIEAEPLDGILTLGTSSGIKTFSSVLSEAVPRAEVGIPDTVWSRTGVVYLEKAGTVEPETLMRYDTYGTQYTYKPHNGFLLEDFGYGPSSDPVWNSRVFNALVKHARGGLIRSCTINATVYHDAPVDIVNRVSIELPKSLKIRKTSATVGSISRKITPTGQVERTYVFNKDCLFNIIPETDTINYAIYVNVTGGDLGGTGSSTKGVFDAPMVAYCSLSDVLSSESKFFWSGIDCWQNTFMDIRSRFSELHFEIPTGTSNVFIRTACDGGRDGTSTGTGYRLGCSYTVMSGCAADKLQTSYDFHGNAEATLTGCGTESFGRLLRVRDNAKVIAKGSRFQYDVVGSNLGISAEPWTVSDNAKVMLEGCTLIAYNFTDKTDSEAFSKLSKPSASGASMLSLVDCVHPSESSSSSAVFTGDKIYTAGTSVGIVTVGADTTKYTPKSIHTGGTGIKQRHEKTVTGVKCDGTWANLASFDISAYGSSLMGSIGLTLYSAYSSGIGLAARGVIHVAACQESAGGVVKVDSKASVFAVVDFSRDHPAPTVEAQLSVSGTSAVLQVKVMPASGSVNPCTVNIEAEYTSRNAGNLGRIDMV